MNVIGEYLLEKGRFIAWLLKYNKLLIFKWLILLFMFCLFFVVFLAIYAGPSVVVVDGDTIQWRSKSERKMETFRLIAMDAPELTQQCMDSDGFPYLCGERSRDKLSMILESGSAYSSNLKCNVDKDVSGHISRDRWGRILGVCWTWNIEDINPNTGSPKMIDIGRLMVRQGWAVTHSIMSDEYNEEEDWARENKLGLWSGEFERPELWRIKNQPDHS